MRSLAWSSRLQESEQRLARQERKERARPTAGAIGQFRVSPTCPPSTSLRIFGGQALPDLATGWNDYNVQIPALMVDLSNGTIIGSSNNHYNGVELSLIAPTPLCYWAVILSLHSEWIYFREFYGDDPFDDFQYLYYGAQTAYTTVDEAEDWIDLLLNGSGVGEDIMQPYKWDRMPLYAIILRNNGNTTAPNQFLPIDAINRGRSYLYRDMRSPIWLLE